MNVQPVSADLLIKLGIGAAVIGAVVYGARQAAAAFKGVPQKWWDTATNDASAAANAINPLNNNNVFAQGADAAASAATGKPNNWGGVIFDVFNPAPDLTVKPKAVAPPAVAMFDQPQYDAMGNPTGYN